METLTKCAKALGDWLYTIYDTQVPLLGVSFWTLALSVFIFTLFLRTIRRDNTTNSKVRGTDSNNNKVYKDR